MEKKFALVCMMDKLYFLSDFDLSEHSLLLETILVYKL